MCTEVHSSRHLMFCSADRFWHCSQGSSDKHVCRAVYVCTDVHLCVCARARASVDSIKESDRKHFCCLDWSRGPGPIMQCSHYSVSTVYTARRGTS